MNRIVECIANFSEGRRPEVVEAIAAAIISGPEIYLLDRTMDADHNRCVITFAGSPEAIGNAAFRGVEAASRLIDLRNHQGAHPRIGAADVIPFVPIRGVTIDDCVAIAKELGRRIATELKIPVYLYEAAAARADRVNLENIRRGQYEGLREEIEKNVDRLPDFGEALIHPTAGATVVGARKPLIAYNINLNTPDLSIAKHIAKRIRFSSGGFPYVKGMGVMLRERNLSQVSMNLTDYEHTPIELVFETVQREALAFGVTVAGSEIIGLIPQGALEQAAAFFLRVENFKPSMVLENRLAEVISSEAAEDIGLSAFVEQVAAVPWVPGSASVLALSAALGVALGKMVIRITMDRTDSHQDGEHFSRALAQLSRLGLELFELIRSNTGTPACKISMDAASMAPWSEGAMAQATEISARTVGFALNALMILQDLRPALESRTASDLQVASQMLRSAVRGGVAKIQAHLTGIPNPEQRANYQEMIAASEKRLDELQMKLNDSHSP